MQDRKENLIVKLTFDFSLKVIEFTDRLRKDGKYKMADQLFRSGTAIGANTREAQNAESKSDFIHKMKIAAKETDETEYWLLLCKNSEGYSNPEYLLTDLLVIMKVISKIIGTSKRKLN